MVAAEKFQFLPRSKYTERGAFRFPSNFQAGSYAIHLSHERHCVHDAMPLGGAKHAPCIRLAIKVLLPGPGCLSCKQDYSKELCWLTQKKTSVVALTKRLSNCLKFAPFKELQISVFKILIKVMMLKFLPCGVWKDNFPPIDLFVGDTYRPSNDRNGAGAPSHSLFPEDPNLHNGVLM